MVLVSQGETVVKQMVFARPGAVEVIGMGGCWWWPAWWKMLAVDSMLGHEEELSSSVVGIEGEKVKAVMGAVSCAPVKRLSLPSP